jgi:hypothetical protein
MDLKNFPSEVAAAKRWINNYASEFKNQPVTLLGDDLYSRQPMVEHCLETGMNFIFTCLPESHTALYDWLNPDFSPHLSKPCAGEQGSRGEICTSSFPSAPLPLCPSAFQACEKCGLNYLENIGEVKTLKTFQWHKRSKEIYRYRYVNHIPLRDTQPALAVNWCELTLTRQSDGKVLYQNAFVTRHELTDETVQSVVSAGRSRWKTENENHNVLKTKGYHLEHNFGHGQHHLACFLLTLNLLAFLFHTVLHLVDQPYQQIRLQRGTRKAFFQDILSLTKYLLFDSWQHLIDFMLNDSVFSPATDSS